MTNIPTKTYHVTVIERALAYYEVEAESPRAAAESWQDGEFYDRDDEALDSEGPTIVRERQPDGSWRRVPPSEWDDEPPAAVATPAPGAAAHTPGTWYVDGLAENETQLWIRSRSRPIASICIGREPETDRANACLLAAAPTLLAACRMVVDRWERGDLAEAARTCGAAIAEAMTTSSPPAAAAIDPAKKPYSVLLLYPDWTNDDGTETYYAWVDAPDSLAAFAEAQRQALAANEWTDCDPDDFAPLLVTEGHHYGHPMSSD
jgi:hypothetical protein